MGLNEIIINKRLKFKLGNLYCEITDSFIDVTEMINLNRLEKSVGINMLQTICQNGKRDYKNLKSNNPNDILFTKSDNDFYTLFDDIESTIKKYSNELYSLSI